MLKKMKIFLSSTTHSHRSMGGGLLDRLPYLGTRDTCPNEHRHAFSIPLRCYMPKKIEAPRGQSMKPSPRDEMKGKFHEVRGKAKEKAGTISERS